MHATNTTNRAATKKATAAKACLTLALTAALISPAWAERLSPERSVVGDGEDLQVSISFPKPTSGDLYIAANVGGVLHFFSEHDRWVLSPVAHEFAQTYTGTKRITLGNSSGVLPGTYAVYQVIVSPNAPDVYDSRNWIGGLSSLGHTSFQVKQPTEISGDHDGDGWADDDANHDGFHDDDSDRDGFHDDDSNRDGFHDDDSDRDGFHDDDSDHDGFHDDDLNHDGLHDDLDDDGRSTRR